MPPDARSVGGSPLAWAKTTRAKPIAAAADVKPIFRFIGGLLKVLSTMIPAILASVCEAHHRVAFRVGRAPALNTSQKLLGYEKAL
jgi:hypothetical protein